MKNRSPITTHVLDQKLGKPAKNIFVTLELQINTKWKLLASGKTNEDGRIENLLPFNSKAKKGTYKISFETGKYFSNKTFYPKIEIIFNLQNPDQHYHVPLLLSPYGYTTYRGS